MDDFGGLEKILGDVIGFDVPFSDIPALVPTRKDKNGFATRIVPGLDINFRIADKKGVLEMAQAFVHRFHGADDGSDLRFAAVTTVIGAVGTVENFFNSTAGLGDGRQHPCGDQIQFLFRINPFSHTGLIGHHKYRKTILGEHPDRRQGAGQEVKILHLRDIISVAGKCVDHAVTV